MYATSLTAVRIAWKEGQRQLPHQTYFSIPCKCRRTALSVKATPVVSKKMEKLGLEMRLDLEFHRNQVKGYQCKWWQKKNPQQSCCYFKENSLPSKAVRWCLDVSSTFRVGMLRQAGGVELSHSFFVFLISKRSRIPSGICIYKVDFGWDPRMENKKLQPLSNPPTLFAFGTPKIPVEPGSISSAPHFDIQAVG